MSTVIANSFPAIECKGPAGSVRQIRAPRVSILMPVRDAQRYLRQAVQSILQQSITDFELIIIDDGSTDGTARLTDALQTRDRRIQVMRQAPAGIALALNAGLHVAKGEYIARMDADDIALPHRLAMQVEALDRHPQWVLVGSQIERIDPDGAALCRSCFVTDHEQIDRALLGETNDRWPIAHPTVMIRRSALLDVGGYDESFEAAQDRDLWLRLAERGQLANLDVVLLKLRCHRESVTYSRAQVQQAMSIRAIELACKRRGIAMPSQITPPMHDSDPRYSWAKWALRSGHYLTAWKHLAVLLIERPFSRRNIRAVMQATPLTWVWRRLVRRQMI